MNQTTSARGRAIAERDTSIDRNVAKIEEQRRAPNAIDIMASRLSVSAGKLVDTLRSTVFRDANDAEFAALMLVANHYGLNPLTKEIYAFKAKGGGIIPYVSVDGWIRMMNEHPQFDAIEFEDIVDPEGNLEAIEAIIYRKDRNRPTKVTEYMEECRRDTDPWKKSPNRFLRHRALMQCARIAFGFSGVQPDEDNGVVAYTPETPIRSITPPTREQTATTALPHDPETGEVLSDDETAELDRQSLNEMDGRDDEDHGDQHDGDDETQADGEPEPKQPDPEPAKPAGDAPRIPSTDAQWKTWWEGPKGVKAKIDKATTVDRLTVIRKSHQAQIDAAPEPLATEIADAFFDATAEIGSGSRSSDTGTDG